jgi:hypothetical protein
MLAQAFASPKVASDSESMLSMSGSTAADAPPLPRAKMQVRIEFILRHVRVADRLTNTLLPRTTKITTEQCLSDIGVF